MKILMVYPQCPDSFWSFKHIISLFGKKAYLPPLGLMTVSALLPEEFERKLVYPRSIIKCETLINF